MSVELICEENPRAQALREGPEWMMSVLQIVQP